MPNLIERFRDDGNLELEHSDWTIPNGHYVPDLVPGNGIRVAILLESPHINEVWHGFPLAGPSGEMVAAKMASWDLLDHQLASQGTSIGAIVSRQDIQWLGLMNVCELFLQDGAYSSGNSSSHLELLLCRFSKVREVKRNNLPCRRCTHIQRAQEIIICDLAARIRQLLQRFSSPPLIVPCGRFAEASLDAARITGDIELNSVIADIPCPNFIPHPSNGQWGRSRFADALEHLRSEIANRTAHSLTVEEPIALEAEHQCSHRVPDRDRRDACG